MVVTLLPLSSISNNFLRNIMEKTTIKIWDLPLRLFHWLLVVSLCVNYTTGMLNGLWLEWHVHVGVFILSLMIFRITWGFLGSSYAKFTNFIPTPSKLTAYLSSRWSGIGHNPLGALWIYAFFLFILMQTSFGLFAINDEIDIHGPLYALISSEWSTHFTNWHGTLSNIILFFIALHLLAIAYYTWVKKRNLLLPMITGNVTVSNKYVAKTSPNGKVTALILATTIAGVAFWLIEGDGLLRWLSIAFSEFNA